MLALVLATVVLLTAVPAAQAAGVQPAAAPGSATAPIAVQDILARADEEQQRLDLARQLLAAPQPVDRLRSQFDAIAAPVDTKLRTATGAALRDLPIMRLESLARHWKFDAVRFGRWETEARRAFAPYEDTAMQLAQRRAAWSATRAAGFLDGLPPGLDGRVDAMLAQIDVCEAALGNVLARQFELSQRASALKARIKAGQDDVAAAIDDIDSRLLRLDVAPLWQGFGASGGAPAVLGVLHRGLDIEAQFARTYKAAATSNQQALRVVQLLLLPLIVGLAIRQRYLRRGAPAGGEPLALALRRPVSAWVLLSMLFVLVLEPDAPLLVHEIALLAALIPTLRLLPASAFRWLGIGPYLAVALYIVDRVALLAVGDMAMYRGFLLLLNLLALGLVCLSLRQGRSGQLAQEGATPLARALRPAGWAVLALLAVAVLCNIAGNVSLAETLTSGVIDSGYMALFLYASVAVCQGLLDVIVHQPRLTGRLVHRQGPVLRAVCERLLVFAASAGWVLYSLHHFRLLRPAQGAAATVMNVGIEIGEVSLHLGDVLVFAFSSWLAFWIARAVRRLLREELPGRARLPRGVGNSIASLSYYGVLLIGFLIALSAAGFKVSQLALVFGALGVGIGFGLQNVVNNFVSGLVLMFERPIQPGDVVDAAGVSGTVREIGLRATTIRTFDGADSVVPNGVLLNGNLTNWTMFDRSRRIEITVGVAYGSNPAQVASVLGAAASATAGVASEPAPLVLLTGYGDSALTFVVKAWTGDIATWTQVRGELLERALAALRAAQIEIPYQQIDLNLRTVPDCCEPGALDALKPAEGR